MVKKILILIVVILMGVANAQIPPYPGLLEKIKDGKIEKPYFLKNIEKVKKKGVDQGWRDDVLYDKSGNMDENRIFGPSLTPTGNWKALVILVQFSDQLSSVNASDFDQLIFAQQAGTVWNYYNRVSYGSLDIVTVNYPSDIGWIDAPQSYSYYVNGQNGFGSYPNNAQKLVEDVVYAADPYVDFSQYDNDGDGDVDALFIVHTGPGAEFSGSSDDIWSHAWVTHNTPHLDGVDIFRYSMEPEYWQTPGDMTIGVYCHELGHAGFGLPDVYDTDYSSAGLGHWSLMAAGSWTGTLGDTPTLPDAWNHIQMGYVTPITVASNDNYNIENVEDNAVIYKLWTNGVPGDEYFLVENRQQTGYDAYIPGGGLLIYHVDESVTTGNRNEWYPGHTSSGHYLVALEQADGQWDLEQKNNWGDDGDPYPGNTNNTAFNVTSVPNSNDYNGSDTFVGVNNISSSSMIMVADFQVTNGGSNHPTNLTGTVDQSTGEVNLTWDYGNGTGFDEDFNDGTAENWMPVTGNWNVSNGTYNVSSDGTYKVSTSYYDEEFSNYQFEVKLRKTTAGNSDPDFNVGIYFNGDPSSISGTGNWENGYMMLISANGLWKLAKVINGEWTNIVNWNESENINTGLNSWNVIKVVVANGYIDAYINGVLQGTYFDDTFLSGKVGLKMYDYDLLGAAEFDYATLVPLGKNYAFGAVKQQKIRKVYASGDINENLHSQSDVIRIEKAPNPTRGDNYVYVVGNYSKSFEYFNIYRDGSVVATTTTTNYTDILTSPGTYSYVVTAVDDGVESDPSNTFYAEYTGSASISYSPSAFDEALNVGETETQTLTINNTGNSTLYYNLSFGGSKNRSGVENGNIKNKFEHLELQKGEEDPRKGSKVIKGAGGPDAYGYTWIDSDESGGPEFEWFDISTVGTNSGLNGDDGYITLVLPFAFNFYGQQKDTIYVSTNGFISFNYLGASNYSNQPIPDISQPNDIIAPFWDDLKSGSGSNYYYYDAANNRFIIQYSDWEYYNGSGIANFQVQLYENGTIYFYYQTITGTLNSATIGIENSDATDGLQVAFNTDYIHDNLAIKIQSGPQWLTLGEYTGVVAAGFSEDVELTFDATNLTSGTYNATLNIYHNATNENSPVGIPIQLTVNPVGQPEIQVSPTSFTETLVAGENSNKTLTISNSGNADLNVWFGTSSKAVRLKNKKKLKTKPVLIHKKVLNNNSLTNNKPGKIKVKPISIRDINTVKSNLNIVYINTYNNNDAEFKNYLNNLPNVGSFVEIDGRYSTPNLAELLNYDVAIVASNWGWSDAVLLGDNLADYVDAGGAVCLLEGSLDSGGPWTLQGRIVTSDYSPLEVVDYSNNAVANAVSFVNHPINQNVDSLSTGLFGFHTTTQGAGEPLGTYDNGYLIGAFNSQKPVVAINVFLNDNWWGGDFIQMIANTLDWLTGQNNGWLSVTPTTGTVLPGNSVDFNVNFDASTLEVGTYNCNLIVNSNDPANPQITIPVTLNVVSGGGFVDTVSVPSLSASCNSEIEVPIRVDSTDGQNILSFQFDLYYDATYLTAFDSDEIIDVSGTILDGTWQVMANADTVGKVTIAGFSATPLSGSGDLVKLKFNTMNSEGTCPITISNFLFNDGNPPVYVVNGEVNITCGLCGDADEDGNVYALDASFALQHAIGLITLSEQGEINADVDMGGDVTAFDAALILRHVIGLPEPVPTCFDAPLRPWNFDIKNVNLSFTESKHKLDDGSNIVDVTLDGISDIEGLYSFQAEVELPQQGELSFVNLPESVISGVNKIDAEHYKIAIASAEEIRPEDILIQIEYEGEETNGSISFTNVKLNGQTIDGVILGVDEASKITKYALVGNYPNPFNPSTKIVFEVPRRTNVKIEIYDVLGRKIRTLVNDAYSQGRYEVSWNGKNERGNKVASGMYIAVMQAGNYRHSIKMNLLK